MQAFPDRDDGRIDIDGDDLPETVTQRGRDVVPRSRSNDQRAPFAGRHAEREVIHVAVLRQKPLLRLGIARIDDVGRAEIEQQLMCIAIRGQGVGMSGDYG